MPFSHFTLIYWSTSTYYHHGSYRMRIITSYHKHSGVTAHNSVKLTNSLMMRDFRGAARMGDCVGLATGCCPVANLDRGGTCPCHPCSLNSSISHLIFLLVSASSVAILLLHFGTKPGTTEKSISYNLY